MADQSLIRRLFPSKPQNSPTAMSTAAAWNSPGGGYDKWRAGDAGREQSLPVGSILPKAPLTPDTDTPTPPLGLTGLAGIKRKKQE